MTRVKRIATVCCAALLASLSLTVAAQDFNSNERTYLTFSSAVELPGVTLQPGTYLFKLADSQSNRHIVQVFKQDQRDIIATILAVPAERQEVTGETVVTFRETAENTTPAVQYWYYPGDRIGHEFVYPKDQAMRIAQRTGQNVLTTDGEVASAGSTVSSTAPDGTVSEWSREKAAAPAASEAQSGTVSGTAGVSQTPAATAQNQPQSEETVAPRTESSNPESETPPAEPADAAAADTRGHSSVMAEAEDRASESQTPDAATATADARGHSGVMRDTQERAVGTSGQASELPRTASPLPLAGLLGLLSLGGAIALRRSAR